jgi:hypothetical protein
MSEEKSSGNRKNKTNAAQGKSVRDCFDCACVAETMHASHDAAQLLLRRLELLHHGRQKVMIGVMVPVHALRHLD